MWMLYIANEGPEITGTNYFDGPIAQAGTVLVSCNGGAFRVLVPDSLRVYVPDMRMAQMCIVSRGPWPARGVPDAFEILFDDGSSSPFAFHVSAASFDRVPPTSDDGREFVLSVWTRGPTKELVRPCGYRRVPQIPDLRPWQEPTNPTRS